MLEVTRAIQSWNEELFHWQLDHSPIRFVCLLKEHGESMRISSVVVLL